jgi:hypothetical protein
MNPNHERLHGEMEGDVRRSLDQHYARGRFSTDVKDNLNKKKYDSLDP